MSGSYPSIPPLIRSATECIGAQAQLHEEEMDVYESWLDNSLTQVHTLRALDLNLGRYRAAGILASDPELGAIYRFVSDLSGTAFGGSFFLTAADSNQQRVLVGFADETFHAGYAELTLGWLLRLCERQLAFTEQASNVFQVTGERSREIGKLRAEIGSVLGRSSRCRVEEQTIDGERRYLVVNFRRAPSGAARRIVL